MGFFTDKRYFYENNNTGRNYEDNKKDDDEDDDDDEKENMDDVVEAFLIDDIMHHWTEEQVKEFCSPGGVGDALLEAKVLSTKRTMVRLSKESDFERRKAIIAIQMARAKHDPLYDKLVKYQMLRKQTRAKILQKYGSQAARRAMRGQREYQKTMRNVNLANSGSAAFITADPNRKSQ